jgi:hypothetical protein
VHWPTDVLGGVTMRTALVAGCSQVWLVWPTKGVGSSPGRCSDAPAQEAGHDRAS